MAWQTPRRNQDGVESQLKFSMLGMRHQPGLRGVDDARLLAWRYRIGGVIEPGAGLDLDEGDQAALSGDDIDLAIGGFETLGQDAVALGHQISRGAGLGREPGFERCD